MVTPVVPACRPTAPAHLVTSLALTSALVVAGLLGAGPVAAAEPDAHRVGNVATWGDRDPANDLDWDGNSYFGDDHAGQQQIPADLADLEVTAVAASKSNSMALDRDGRVHVWGDPGNTANGWGTAPPAALANERVTAIDTGPNWMMALTQAGQVKTWGSWDVALPGALTGKTVTKIAAGYGQALALTDESGGKVYAWGTNFYNESSVPAAAQSNVVDIAADFYASVAVKADGSLVAWGDTAIHCGDTPPCPANWTPVPTADSGRRFVDVAVGGASRGIALDDAGKVYPWGYFATPVPAGLADVKVVSISAGGAMFAAVTDDGKVFSWGSDGYPYDHDPNCSLPRDCPPAPGNVQAQDNNAYVPASLGSEQVTAVAVGTTHLVARVRPDLAAVTAPSVKGPARRGGTLTAVPGQTSPDASTVTYRWLRNGAELSATGTTYKPVIADVGAKLSVRVTSATPGYGSLTRTSASTATVVVAPSTTRLRAVPVKPKKVALTVTVIANGIPVAYLDGRCTVLRGTRSNALRTVSTCTVKDSQAKVTVLNQPTGKQYFAVRFEGTAKHAAKSTSTPVAVTVR